MGASACSPLPPLPQDSVRFHVLTHKARRQDAARAFLQVLVLKTRDCVEVEQEVPYADIQISRGVRDLGTRVRQPGAALTLPPLPVP